MPELSLLAHYFLYQCFPNAKICTSAHFKEKKVISKEDLSEYDFAILPASFLNKFENEIVDISINTTSLGEMTDQMQNFYLNQIERVTEKYFYSVNRAKRESKSITLMVSTILTLKKLALIDIWIHSHLSY